MVLSRCLCVSPVLTDVCISWSIFTNHGMSLMSFGVPRALLRFSRLTIIPPMLHTSLQYMVLSPKEINARNFGTFHKPILCGKSVAWYIIYFQLVGSQPYCSCCATPFAPRGKRREASFHSWLERAYTVVCLSQTRHVCFFASSDPHIRMLYATSRP
jgi:hypothetical protein